MIRAMSGAQALQRHRVIHSPGTDRPHWGSKYFGERWPDEIAREPGPRPLMVKQCMGAGGFLLAIGLTALSQFVNAQQPYPSRPIHIIVSFPPGGNADPLARLAGQKLTESWGQPVIIDNRPGGNTIIGTEAAAKAPPDGYTLLLASSGHVITPNLLKTPYDPIKDFAPIATLTSNEYVLVVHPSVPANNLREFIALAKAKPGQLNYASVGTGSTNHLAGELFNLAANVTMTHIPYKGGGPALTDLMGGRVHLSFQTPVLNIPHIRSGKLRAIAISGPTRLAALPEVPTFTEAGLSGLDIRVWYGILAPGATPRPILDRLASEISKGFSQPDVREALAKNGNEPFISTQEQYAALMKADLARYAKVIKAANIQMDK